MTDYTREILALQRARVEMQSAKKLAEVEVKEQYATRIRDEIKRRTEQAELDFAHELKSAVESGIPQSIIRSEVLRTNVWSRWTYWRDLAQIEPERVVLANAKKSAALENATYVWDLEEGTLTVRKNSRGEDLETPLVYQIDTIRRNISGKWIANPQDDDYEREVAQNDQEYAFRKNLHSEIQRAVEAKEITV